MRSLSFGGLAVLALLALACGKEQHTQTGPAPTPAPGLEPVCTAGTRWTPGTASFREVTDAWGLTGVTGVRLAAVDLDGDGYADLVARSGTDEPSAARQLWYLHNEAGKGFADVTVSSGILTNRVQTNPLLGRPGQLYAFGDVDDDGNLDAYSGRSDTPTSPQVETSELLLNQGDGTFALGAADNPFRIASGDAPAGASFVDFDRDGLVDLFVVESTFDGHALQDRLYKNLGGGAFQEVTAAAGLTTLDSTVPAELNAALGHGIGWGALACDLDGDGNPELLAASNGRAPNQLWQATTAGVYGNRSIASGYAFDERVDWTDNESARCHCKLYPTDQDCAGVPPPMYIPCATDADAVRWNHATDREPYRLGGNSGTTVCADVDGDGDMDLLTSETAHWDVGSSSDQSELLFNTGEPNALFQRTGNSVTGLLREHPRSDWNDGDMTAAIFDFDNDGLPDIYIGSSDYPGTIGLLFHQISPGMFEMVPPADGIDHHRSDGIAVADFDHDGDLDVIVGHSLARCDTDCYATGNVRMFENTLGGGGNFVELALEGSDGTNRAAIGARVTLTTDDGRSQTQEVGGGYGHYGIEHDLTLHFGLGASCRASVTVRWPNAALTSQTIDVVAGYRFRVQQGQAAEPTRIAKP